MEKEKDKTNPTELHCMEERMQLGQNGSWLVWCLHHKTLFVGFGLVSELGLSCVEGFN